MNLLTDTLDLGSKCTANSISNTVKKDIKKDNLDLEACKVTVASILLQH